MSQKVERKTQEIDAADQVLGRVATRVANFLNGKHKVNYAPHLDMGDFVIVKNVSKIKLTGKKLRDKILRHHTNYPGGLKEIMAKDLLQRNPAEVLRRAVANMIPKNRLRKRKLLRLRAEA